VRTEFPSGKNIFYKGAAGFERAVKSEDKSGKKWFFKGKQDFEKLVRTEDPNVQTQFYEGEQDSERLVRVEFSSGSKQFYEGDRGSEHLVRAEFPNGKINFYNGTKNNETCVRTEYSNGYNGREHSQRRMRRNNRRNVKGTSQSSHSQEQAPSAEFVAAELERQRQEHRCKYEEHLEEERERERTEEAKRAIEKQARRVETETAKLSELKARELRNAYVEPKKPTPKGSNEAKRTTEQAAVHDVHTSDAAKSSRAAAFNAKQEQEHADRLAREKHAKEHLLKQMDSEVAKQDAVATHLVPPPPTIGSALEACVRTRT